MATDNKGELDGDRLRNIQAHANKVIATLRVKNPKYGDSWKAQGGFSAFFNTSRKWSRIENLAKQYSYDIFAALRDTDQEEDGMEEAMRDLVGYLLLALDECVQMAPTTCFYRSVYECPDPNCKVHGPHAVQGEELKS